MNSSHQAAIFNNEKRVAPRYTVNLRSSVIITAVSYSSADNETYLVLQGRLLDVSRTGLALVISRTDLLELKQLGTDVVFRLLLPLPGQAIELEATPVRYQQLDDSEAGQVLVGANITNMNGRDRIVFIDFIHQFEDLQDF